MKNVLVEYFFQLGFWATTRRKRTKVLWCLFLPPCPLFFVCADKNVSLIHPLSSLPTLDPLFLQGSSERWGCQNEQLWLQLPQVLTGRGRSLPIFQTGQVQGMASKALGEFPECLENDWWLFLCPWYFNELTQRTPFSCFCLEFL